MADVFLSLGSNIHRERYITAALDGLSQLFGTLECSSVYESEAVGFDGDHFYNLVVVIKTELPVGALSKVLRHLEEENGRDREAPRFSARTLDVDILSYEQCCAVVDGINLPREEILYNAFVLKPLAELVPSECHPIEGKTYAALWDEFDQGSQRLWRIPFVWQGKSLGEPG
ncbi:MAG: 2-amino-4-hydroxy-6-hydroxymethyldihydropteridine diphosphokinase [Pseudomonadales bacterium]|nr:2-amino-4-hydroxy-6-hydroxymethyldihydropteridine diphosphokinase [Pseudomonadales bacterium]